MHALPMSVAIIGGGFSGAVTAIHLLRSAHAPDLRISLIDNSVRIARGLAYRFDDDNLLLNVPAGQMSALADEGGHFVAYCQTIDPSITARSFVSRRLYGDYLQHTLDSASKSHPGVLTSVSDDVLSLTRDTAAGPWQIGLASGTGVAAEQVVLALGHQACKFPLAMDARAQQHLIGPWDFAAMQRIPSNSPVMILGTSHTAVDALFNLTRINHERQVWLVSRHGLLPNAHRLNAQAPVPRELPAYLRLTAATMCGRMRAVRQEISRQQQAGLDWRDVLNELRPHTSQLWRDLMPTQRNQFLRHVQPYWDVHRHRLAPVAAQRLHRLLQAGSVRVVAARVINIQHDDDGLNIKLRPRGAAACQHIQAAAIVNCTGPNTHVNTLSHPLFKQLLQTGLIQADACKLGIRVTSGHQTLGSNDMPVDGLWYVGPMLKAQHWEATAVPELRVHAQQLAQTLLACLPKHRTTGL